MERNPGLRRRLTLLGISMLLLYHCFSIVGGIQSTAKHNVSDSPRTGTVGIPVKWIRLKTFINRVEHRYKFAQQQCAAYEKSKESNSTAVDIVERCKRLKAEFEDATNQLTSLLSKENIHRYEQGHIKNISLLLDKLLENMGKNGALLDDVQVEELIKKYTAILDNAHSILLHTLKQTHRAPIKKPNQPTQIVEPSPAETDEVSPTEPSRGVTPALDQERHPSPEEEESSDEEDHQATQIVEPSPAETDEVSPTEPSRGVTPALDQERHPSPEEEESSDEEDHQATQIVEPSPAETDEVSPTEPSQEEESSDEEDHQATQIVEPSPAETDEVSPTEPSRGVTPALDQERHPSPEEEESSDEEDDNSNVSRKDNINLQDSQGNKHVDVPSMSTSRQVPEHGEGDSSILRGTLAPENKDGDITSSLPVSTIKEDGLDDEFTFIMDAILRKDMDSDGIIDGKNQPSVNAPDHMTEPPRPHPIYFKILDFNAVNLLRQSHEAGIVDKTRAHLPLGRIPRENAGKIAKRQIPTVHIIAKDQVDARRNKSQYVSASMFIINILAIVQAFASL
ncbi:proteoglycan 4, putative [Babesia ovis]|uniref:Proteoglycan 4, putative n=1 Tax=Babesia ovis TaxID=5869 RepID=A0A9W5WUA5_BABOV|nr:proteoglycan 4, putative [Babesia ovis]